jgi:aspartokinase
VNDPKLVKQTISRAVKDAIEGDVSLQDALQRGYGNISAIARLISPQVEATLGRPVNMESLITSIKRIRVDYRPSSTHISKIIAESIVNVRTDVAKISVEKTKRALEAVRRLLANYQEEFLQVSESISAITIIVDQRMLDTIIDHFREADILEKEPDLAAIIMHSPEEIVRTPGCAAAFYNQVSRRHVNIEDTISCYTDTIIVVRMRDIGRAFTALTDLISEARRSRSTSNPL